MYQESGASRILLITICTADIGSGMEIYMDLKKRIETDFIGEKQIPSNAYYGINAIRGYENFNISDDRIDYTLIKTIAWVKKACVLANIDCTSINEDVSNAIIKACDKVAEGNYNNQFIVNPIQGGGGTSFNMTANEVIANIALEILGYKKGDYDVINPLLHVNMSQSTNDVFPTAINLALVLKLESLLKTINAIKETLIIKSQEMKSFIKMGRTHLNAASPIDFGQCFDAYASLLIRDYERINNEVNNLRYIPLGGTVIGTGLNTSPLYRRCVIEHLRQISEINVVPCSNLSDGIQNVDNYTMLSSALKVCILNLSKIASDLRLLGSDPRYGLGELFLPPRQLGSSIIPDKVNPVMAELINQVSFIICGYDLTISMSAQAGQLELNVYKSTIAYCLFRSIDMMTKSISLFDQFCLKELKVLEKFIKK